MFYFDLYIINVDVILPLDLGPFAVNKYIHTYKYIFTCFKYGWNNLLANPYFIPNTHIT
jgi:predicted YcjX-like family ATPase